MDIQNNEFDSFYANYITLAMEFNFASGFAMQRDRVVAFFQNLSYEKWDYSYQPAKWTIKDVLLHMVDTERIFAYRALRISRNDKIPLPGFDENEYAVKANASSRTVESLIEEYISVRNATITLFQSFSDKQLLEIGIASGKEISVRAIGYIILGHEKHHLNIIKERYL